MPGVVVFVLICLDAVGVFPWFVGSEGDDLAGAVMLIIDPKQNLRNFLPKPSTASSDNNVSPSEFIDTAAEE